MTGDPRDRDKGKKRDLWLAVKVQADEINFIRPVPEKNGNLFKITLSAYVTKGKPFEGAVVQFHVAGASTGDTQQSDENGKAFETIRFDSGSSFVTIEAIATFQTGAGDKWTARDVQRIILPHPEKKSEEKSEPAELIVDPTRVGNRINFFIRVIDERNKGVKNTKITIVDGVNVITQHLDEDGEHMLTVNLGPDEEREIAIYVAGYGDKGFRETFRGRRQENVN